MAEKKDFLREEIEHIDIKKHNVVPLVESYKNMAVQARNLYRASRYYDMMLEDKNCSVILCLAGSLFSAGLKNVVVDMVRNNMVDAIVSTGAIMVDQDFFEGLNDLYSIDLQGNRIDNVQNLAFANLPSLNHLDIRLIFTHFIDWLFPSFVDDQKVLCLVSEGFAMSSVSSKESLCLVADKDR